MKNSLSKAVYAMGGRIVMALVFSSFLFPASGGAQTQTLTVAVSPVGVETASPTVTNVVMSNVVNLAVTTANTSYVFAGWQWTPTNGMSLSSGTTNNASISVLITSTNAPLSVVANFQAKPRQSLTVSVSPSGLETVNITTTNVALSNVVSLAVTTNNPAYVFSGWGWTPTNGMSLTSGTTNDASISVLITSTNAPLSAVANFQARPGAQPLALSLSPAGAGTVSSSLGSNNYVTVNQVITLTAAESNPSYIFAGWRFFPTNGIGLDPSDPFQTTNDPVVTVLISSTNAPLFARANFLSRGVYLNIVANPTNGGYTVPPLGTNWYAVGATTPPITATASNGFEFVQWESAANTPANHVQIYMDASKDLYARFSRKWTFSQAFPGGPSDLATNVFTVRDGAYTNIAPPSIIVGLSGNQRYRCNGWIGGTGSVIPATKTGADAASVNVTVTTNSGLSWLWVQQFKVDATNTAVGTVAIQELGTDNDPNDRWVDTGSSVRVSVAALDPSKFEPDYVSVNGARRDLSPTYQVDIQVTNSMSIVPFFRTSSMDDPGFVAYMARFQLRAGSTMQHTYDDPDGDGLSNIQEYNLSNTNKGWFYNPINSDTDGDGMDDKYESESVDPTNIADSARANFHPAATDNGAGVYDNGSEGNPDQDFHWSTNNGYMLPDPLMNIEEYQGPDGIAPYTMQTVSFGDALYPFPANPVGYRPDVVIRVAVPGDTVDQSKANAANSDRDIFDDGYEYTWDKWQQANSGMQEVILVGVTNQVAVYITNTVPVWATATRVFNPGKTDHPGDGPDGDILYDYNSGKVSLLYYSADREYNAWQPTAFSQTIGNAPHTIRMDSPPKMPDGVAPRRSSHPFLWDVDGDGLPDGYEVIFGYDPWSPLTSGSVESDGQDNPDNDWMAWSGITNDVGVIASSNTIPFAWRNHEVYLTNGFSPFVAVGPAITNNATVKKYSTVDEMRGPDGLISLSPSLPGSGADDATNPRSVDSDGDGIWDGWENYVGLNPSEPADAALDPDGDALVNLDEFRSYYTSSTNLDALTPLTNWLNKIYPTDPGVDPSPASLCSADDTDGDGIPDGAEKGFFNGDTFGGGSVTNLALVPNEAGILVMKEVVSTYGVSSGGGCSPGGGLNPTTCDTDGDSLPDPYEACYPGALDGTVGDAFNDPDGDGLKNYQEYWTCSVYHWHYSANTTNDTYIEPFWVPGMGSYNNADFFQGVPLPWDPSQLPYIPLYGPTKAIGSFAYAGTRPDQVDSDEDGMDDYYEIYHGLDPLYGTVDLVSCQRQEKDDCPSTGIGNVLTQPWTAGHPQADPDGDGLMNFEEAPNSLYPEQSPRYHTDPSPLWMTDMEYDRSWVNLYYQNNAINVWPWSGSESPPTYAFSFESNEGYDTDNDGLSDKEELTITHSDPLTPERPVKRRALYLPPGGQAYARTYPNYSPSLADAGGGWLSGLNIVTPVEDAFRSFTVEAWVRPVNPTNGTDQVIVERPLLIPSDNRLGLVSGVRLNFRLAIGGNGKPYVKYTGSGWESEYGDQVLMGSTVVSTNWTHLAATYQVANNLNANQGGTLSLYVNGALAGRVHSSLLPATGAYYLGGSIITLDGAPIIVGAADNNPNGTFGISSILNQPAPTNFFTGWIDEVRIWNGARSDSQIQSSRFSQFRQSDIMAQQRPEPTLKYLYTFDGMPTPGDTNSVLGMPRGFTNTASFKFPAGWTAAFWNSTPQKSLVYTDYRYVPWIENIATHTPETPPSDIGDTNNANMFTVGTGATVTVTANFWNTSNPYGVRYFTQKSTLGQIFDQYNDLLPLLNAQTDDTIPMWDNGTPGNSLTYDSDGDGLPDQWEQLYGLDPLDPNGVNGASGDPDNDGLSNMAEYLAGTDPMNADTYGWGFGDYNSWSGMTFRTYGELYTDHDGLPDTWEMAHGLDTKIYDAYGVYGDPDGDGWANFTEYMKDTDPQDVSSHPDPIVNGIIKYNGTRTNGSVIVLGYQTPSMDGDPIRGTSGGGVVRSETESLGSGDGQTTVFTGTLKHGSIVKGSVKVRRLNPQFVTPDFDFTDNAAGQWTYYPDYLNSQATTNVTFDYGSGAYTFRWPARDGFGMVASWNNDQVFIDYQWKDGDPNSFSIKGLKDGELYLFAYRDNNGNNQWDAGEPAGIAERQAIHLGWEDLTGVVIGLTDEAPPGHLRFTWPQVAGQASYVIRVVNNSLVNAPFVFACTNKAPQNWFHEGQMNNLGFFLGLSTASYQWFAKQSDGITAITNGSIVVVNQEPAIPTVLSPVGGTINYSSMELLWTMDTRADRFRVQISTNYGFSSVFYEWVGDTPFRTLDVLNNATYRCPVPIHPGSGAFTNGLYYWRIQAINGNYPNGYPSGSYSAPGEFRVKIEDPPSGVSTLSGEVKYYGKAGGTNTSVYILQAYNNGGFGGEPVAQVSITNTPDPALIASLTNSPSVSGVPLTPFDKGQYKIMGLRSGTYYIKAFKDSYTNGVADVWETQGFLATTVGRPRGVLVGTGSVELNKDITLVDRDTDADGLPDGWEWTPAAQLTRTGTTEDSLGVTLMMKYSSTYFDADPNHALDRLISYELIHGLAPGADSDGDGLSDAVEVLVTHTDPKLANDALRARSCVASRPGMGMSLTWDGKDGVTYQVQVSSNLKTWADAPMGSFSGPGTKTFVDTASAGVPTRFYRIVVR